MSKGRLLRIAFAVGRQVGRSDGKVGGRSCPCDTGAVQNHSERRLRTTSCREGGGQPDLRCTRIYPAGHRGTCEMSPQAYRPTDEQLAIIDHDGSAFVTACPGAGKTWVLTERARRLLDDMPVGQGV